MKRLQKIKKSIYLLIIFVLITSCGDIENDIYNDLVGNWAIHKIKYNDVDYMDKLYSMNVINIWENKTLSLPEIDVYKKEKEATWKFTFKDEKLKKLFIESENKVINGVFEADFFKGDKLDKLILKSSETYIELHKL